MNDNRIDVWFLSIKTAGRLPEEVRKPMKTMKYSLPIVPETGNSRKLKFDGELLGSSDRPLDGTARYKTSVEIYRTSDGLYLTYVAYRDKDGNIGQADCIRTESLDFKAVRSSLRQASIYPGKIFAQALYKSFRSLEKSH